MTKDTFPELFIIESLTFEDERGRKLEGEILRDILALSGRPADYIYIRTEKEFVAALDQFYDTQKRYLHISCHGDPANVSLTLDRLSFSRFGELVRNHLNQRRLFFSACEVVNDSLAEKVLIGSDCYSLIGPKDQIRIDDAVLMWASFYHLMFRDGEDSMKGGKIRWALRRVKSAFEAEFDYFKPEGGRFIKVDIEER